MRCEVLFGCVRACDPKLEDCMETIAFYLFFFTSPKKEPKKSSLKKPMLKLYSKLQISVISSGVEILHTRFAHFIFNA